MSGALRFNSCDQARIEIGRRLDNRKIAKDKQRTSDLGIVPCASLTLEQMPLHGDDFIAGKNIIDESDVLASKTATVHRRQDPHETIRVTVPAPEGGVPGYECAPCHGRGCPAAMRQPRPARSATDRPGF